MLTPSATPCLFLSHSGPDTDAARELKRRLLDSPDARAARLTIWLDKDDLGAGIGWQAQIEKAINEKTTAFAVHLGAKGVLNWVDSEVRLGLSRAAGRCGLPLHPNILPGMRGRRRTAAVWAAVPGGPRPAQQSGRVRQAAARRTRPIAQRKSCRSRKSVRRTQVDDGSRCGSVLRPQRRDCRSRRQAQAAPASCRCRRQRCRQVLACSGRGSFRPFGRQALRYGGPRARRPAVARCRHAPRTRPDRGFEAGRDRGGCAARSLGGRMQRAAQARRPRGPERDPRMRSVAIWGSARRKHC